MEKKSFHLRLEELPKALDVTWETLANVIGMPYTQLYDIRNRKGILMQTVNRIALKLDMVPVILYFGDEIENLGIEHLVSGEPVENYIGGVFRSRRTKLGLTLHNLEEVTHIRQTQLSQYELGSLMRLPRFEAICDGLGLTPSYLVTKMPEVTAETFPRAFEETIRSLEYYLAADSHNIDSGIAGTMLEYVNRIWELGEALRVRREIMFRE
jgi:transcriptional regulator with XRE-family HTH domain/DNA-binding Xre family transcriptional regulator